MLRHWAKEATNRTLGYRMARQTVTSCTAIGSDDTPEIALERATCVT